MTPSSPSPRKQQPETTQRAGEASAAFPPPPRRIARKQRTSSRRTSLSLDAVVAAAIDVLDESGVAGLTMRRVADRLDTGAASLYAYVSGRDELLELVFDELIGRVPLPDPDPAIWRDQLRQMLRDLREILSSHRDAALAGLGRIVTSPRALAGSETLVAVMRAGGLSDKAVALGLDQLTLYVCACAFEAGLFDHSGMTSAEVAQYFAEVHAFYGALPTDRFPVLSSVAPSMAGYDEHARFEFGLDVLIAGLEAVDRAD
jgi:AcrR family transcriptional regulator